MRLNLFPLVTAGLLLGSCFVTTADEAKLKRVHIKDGHFYAGEERLRLWGFGAPQGLTLSDEQQTLCVERLRFLNVNCLRMAGIAAQHYPAGVLAYKAPVTGTIDPKLRDGFFRLQDRLREAGIYITITISGGRRLRPDDGDVLQTTPKDAEAWRQAINELRGNRGGHHEHQLLATFDERARAVRKLVASRILNLTNPRTGRRLAEDPQLALIETTNETFANDLIYRRKMHLALPEYFQTKLNARWNQYLRDKYGSTAKLRAAWQPGAEEQEMIRAGLGAAESLEAGNIALEPLKDDDGFTQARHEDVLNFCVWLDIADQQDMVKHYRELGYPGPSIHSAFWTYFDGPVDSYLDAVCPYVEDHAYMGAHDVIRAAAVVAAKKKLKREGRPFWRSEGRNSGGAGFPLHRTRVANPLYIATYFALLNRDGMTFHSWNMRERFDYLFEDITHPVVPDEPANKAYTLILDVAWQMIFRAAGHLFQSGEIYPLPPRYEEEDVLGQNSDVSTPQVYRSRKQGVLLVQTDNFLAVANDKPGEYELSWGKFELTSGRLNVIVVERTAPHEYEITAVGMAGDTVPNGGVLNFEPRTWVTGNVILTKEKGSAQVIQLSDQGEMLNMETVAGTPLTIPLVEGVRLYRVKIQP